MIRDKIVRIVHDCENDTCETCQWFNGIVGCQEPRSVEIHEIYKERFKDLVDKLEVIDSNEMSKVKFDMGSPWGLVDRATVGKAIAKAQLQLDKDKLKEML